MKGRCNVGSSDQERRAQLIAAALSAELNDAECAELEQLKASDPTIEAEIESLSAVVGRVQRGASGIDPQALSPRDLDPPRGLRDSIMAAAEAGAETGEEPGVVQPEPEPEPQAQPEPETRNEPSARRKGAWHKPVFVAAACFVLGIAVALSVVSLQDRPPQGPPGTLGAVEEVELSPVDGDVEIEAALIAHTWGTESVLEVQGLIVGERYDVLLITRDGVEFDSGAFLGSEVRIDCQMNAAVMRDEVVRLEIRTAEGDVVTAANLPDAVES